MVLVDEMWNSVVSTYWYGKGSAEALRDTVAVLHIGSESDASPPRIEPETAREKCFTT